jgi:hypothetical protein
MNTRPRKRARHERTTVAASDNTLHRNRDFNAAHEILDEQIETKPSTADSASVGKSFLEIAVDAQQDTQPVETQNFQEQFNAAKAYKKLARQSARDSSSAALGALAMHNNDTNSDEEYENLVTDPIEHPPTLGNKHAIFSIPRTPMVGSKINMSGNPLSEIRTSATRTPANAVFGFGAGMGGFGLTQAYGDTQVDISPLNPKSDPVFDRPSPLFHHRDPTPRKYFTSSPPPKDGEVETQQMDLHPISMQDDPSSTKCSKGKSSISLSLPDMNASLNISLPVKKAGKIRLNPVVIDEDPDTADSDEEAPITCFKPRGSPIEIPQTSSKEFPSQLDCITRNNPGMEHSNLYIEGTPEGSPAGRRSIKAVGTQNSDRVTDSQCSPRHLILSKTPQSSIHIDAQKSQSMYSRLSPHRLARLGEETQAALNTSPPRGPPPLKSSDSDSQEHVQSSPPNVDELADNSMSQKFSSNHRVSIVNPDQRDDEIRDDEIYDLETQERNTESMIDLGLGELSATQITSPARISQGNLRHLSAVDRESQVETQAETVDEEHEVISIITAQSRLAENGEKDGENHSQESVAQIPLLSTVTGFKKLSEIAAEASQSLPPLVEIHFSQDQTEAERYYDQIIRDGDVSGSSPIARRRQKRHKTESHSREEPEERDATSQTPAKSVNAQSLEKLPRVRQGTVSVLPQKSSIAQSFDTPLSPERSSSPELELGVEITGFHKPTDRPTAVGSSLKKSTLVRPMKFLESTARKRAAVQDKPKRKSNNVYDIEETQFEIQSTVPGQRSQSISHGMDVPAAEPTLAALPTVAEPCGDFTRDLSHENEIFPTRIFAYYGGQYRACFPATCQKVLRTRGSATRLDITFDDGTSGTIDADKWVYKLALRVGDLVRVDCPTVKKKNYLVHGFMNKIEPKDGQETPIDEHGLPIATDIYGYQTVCVIAKGRESTSSRAASDLALQDFFEVPVKTITIPPLEFHRFEDRKYCPSDDLIATRPVATPLLMTIEPEKSTQARASRRSTTAPVVPPILEQSISTVSSMSRFSAVKPVSGRIFANMAFAISMSSDMDRKRKEVTQTIARNDGQLLEDGFEPLFTLTNISLRPSTAVSDPNFETYVVEAVRNSMQLSASYKDTGFTALLADSHARRPKHMQALALNIPILHYRWIEDSIKADKAMPWSRYLLPAGESSFLNDAIRSRCLSPYDPISNEAQLETVVQKRTVFFADKSVLFVAGRKMEAKRKLFKFLTMAMGPHQLTPVTDLVEAKNAMDRQKWDWIFVESEDQVDAAQKLFEKEDCWVVDDEYVVQSLILGELAE